MIKDIAFTAYPADDVTALRAFYNDTMGLSLGEAMDFEGRPAYCEGPVGSGYFALLLPEWIERPKGSGAGVVFETDDLAGMTAKLATVGITVSEPQVFPMCTLADFLDPEGNKVHLHETTTPH